MKVTLPLIHQWLQCHELEVTACAPKPDQPVPTLETAIPIHRFCNEPLTLHLSLHRADYLPLGEAPPHLKFFHVDVVYPVKIEEGDLLDGLKVISLLNKIAWLGALKVDYERKEVSYRAVLPLTDRKDLEPVVVHFVKIAAETAAFFGTSIEEIFCEHKDIYEYSHSRHLI
ncbi:MAG: hypothetical protein KDK65_00750 [Chlamydiia bacterium]|nr:hypothetical protein [Chlamydiia bacterium]